MFGFIGCFFGIFGCLGTINALKNYSGDLQDILLCFIQKNTITIHNHNAIIIIINAIMLLFYFKQPKRINPQPVCIGSSSPE